MLSRAVAVIRTNVIDSGLGLAVFGIFKKEGEDRHVTNAALAAVCNIVTDFSPLRPVRSDLISFETFLLILFTSFLLNKVGLRDSFNFSTQMSLNFA